MSTLADQVAVVTGAGSGIGQAIALALSDAGMRVVLVGRDLDKLQGVAARCNGSRFHCYACDVTDETAQSQLANQLCAEFAQIGVLVHSAGLVAHGPLDRIDPVLFDRQYRVNLWAPFALTQRLLPALTEAQGQVVFLNSSLGMQAQPQRGLYSATKHGLRALANSLRDEVNPLGVRVVSLYLGQTATPTQERLYREAEQPYRPERLMQADEVAQLTRHVLELSRSCEVTDIHMRPMLKPS